ncbi:MAG: ribosomal protein S18 acetylase RimI-like enzyme [Planctomycetaceae bacterium]|jgi:ribosomal protein S18 acetylase RimI-like enzyme
MRIELLHDHAELAKIIGRWHWQEWGHADPGGSVDTWIEGIAGRNNSNTIPMTCVGLSDDGELLGSVSLVECDMETHPELYPWLAGLYVSPTSRNAGVGSALTVHAFESANSMGIDRLYLYTSKAKSLYESLGWVVIGSEYYEGEDVTIMCKSNI